MLQIGFCNIPAQNTILQDRKADAAYPPLHAECDGTTRSSAPWPTAQDVIRAMTPESVNRIAAAYGVQGECTAYAAEEAAAMIRQ